LVNNALLATVAGELGMVPLIRGVFPAGDLPLNVVADAFEAFVGTLLLDQSMAHVEVFCRLCLIPRISSREAIDSLNIRKAHNTLLIQTSGKVAFEYSSAFPEDPPSPLFKKNLIPLVVYE